MSRDSTPPGLQGRVVLVTGGSGFLGSALIQRLLEYDLAEVRILTRKSTSSSLPHSSPGKRPRSVVGDLSDHRVLKEAVRGAHVLFHLAAMKSVELCENSPREAINTNVQGTATLIRAALLEPELERFIAVSSDKASKPTSVYGVTKALMERMVAEADGLNSTDYGTIRCGNLWGSTGSVLARWEEAARTGADLLVTAPETTRFIMRRPEAVDLILEAASRTMAGSILSRVMPAYALGDLAALMSEAHDLKVRVTGRRPSEKLHEDLVSDDEAPFAERQGEFFRITLGRRGSGADPFNSGNARRLAQSDLRALLNASLVSSA